jgi:hypothetical protein
LILTFVAWYRGQRAQNKGVTLANLVWVAASFVAIAMQFISFKGLVFSCASTGGC